MAGYLRGAVILLWLTASAAGWLQAQGTVRILFDERPSRTLTQGLLRELNGSAVDGARWHFALDKDESDLILVEVHGSCRVASETAPRRNAPLGWVQVVDGEWLPFIHVDCQRLAEAVHAQMVFGDLLAESHMAKAIAVVVRHELKHLTLRTFRHDESGEFRAALSRRELW